MSSSVDSRRTLARTPEAPPGVTSGFVMSLTRSGQVVFFLSIAGTVLFILMPEQAPMLSAMASFITVLLIGIGVNTYRPRHWWPWGLLGARWATVGMASLLAALDPKHHTDFGANIALELTRIGAIVAIAALFLYARPRRLLDVTTVITLGLFCFASLLALSPTQTAHLSMTRIVVSTSRPELFAALALGTWFIFGFLIMRLGPILPTALARIGLGAWLAMGVAGSVAVTHAMTGSTREILWNVPYMYSWTLALATAAGALHPSMAHLRPTPDRVWTPIVERAAYFGAIVVALPLAMLVPQLFASELQEAVCYGTLAAVVLISVARITTLNSQLSGRRRLGPRALRESLPGETRELQALVDHVRISDLLAPADVIVTTFTLRGLNELRLLVGTERQLELEARWASDLLRNLPPTVRAVRLRPGCVVALLRTDLPEYAEQSHVVAALVTHVRSNMGRISDGSVVLDVIVGAAELPDFDLSSVELAVALAENSAVSLRTGVVEPSTLAAHYEWRLRQTVLRHLALDADYSASLSVVGERFVDLHTSDVVGMRVAASFDVDGDEPLSGEDLATLVAEACADGRFYAKVLADAMTWACANLHVGSILVAPVTANALMDDEFISQLLRSQADARVGRIELWLEVPASNLTTVSPGLPERMEFLTLQGLKLMVGEFGNDHANLASLATLPLHALALDEDFVSTVGLYLRSGVLAANVASMAWDLDYTVVAGGIKYADQREELADAACKYAWGPLFGNPQELTSPARSTV